MRNLSLFLFILLLVTTLLWRLEVDYWKGKSIEYSNQINEIGKITEEIYNKLHFTDTVFVEKIYPADSIDNRKVFYITGYDSTSIKALVYDFKKHGIYESLDALIINPDGIYGYGGYLPDSSFIFLGNSVERFLDTKEK